MKKILLLLTLIPAFSHSQDIPKFSNTIVARGVSFNQIKDSLLDCGYFIDQQNEEDGTIITKPKGVCDCKNVDFNQLILYIRVKDSVAKFSGSWNMNYNYNALKGGFLSNDKSNFHKLEYWKSGISVPHKIFLLMDSFVRKLTANVSYSKM